ncbi:MAG: hypothetical protein ABI832_04560 [bacterium]
MSHISIARPALIRTALRDLGDDIIDTAMTLTHGLFDLSCMVVLGLAVYASGLDDGAAHGRVLTGEQASLTHAAMGPQRPCATDLAAGGQTCITATVLKPINS